MDVGENPAGSKIEVEMVEFDGVRKRQGGRSFLAGFILLQGQARVPLRTQEAQAAGLCARRLVYRNASTIAAVLLRMMARYELFSGESPNVSS